VDGVLVLDLPIEEADECRALLASRGIDTILLVSPTTTDERLGRAAALGSGFLYAISRLGVTGARDAVAEGAEEMVRDPGRQLCPSPGLASRSRNTCAKWGNGRMPPWSAARSSA
jgi:tryptophan synthase alpha subunit